ncbi:hypothetical protein FOL47_000878, partial [Perkinsus chesapeaki]
ALHRLLGLLLLDVVLGIKNSLEKVRVSQEPVILGFQWDLKSDVVGVANPKAETILCNIECLLHESRENKRWMCHVAKLLKPKLRSLYACKTVAEWLDCRTIALSQEAKSDLEFFLATLKEELRGQHVAGDGPSLARIPSSFLLGWGSKLGGFSHESDVTVVISDSSTSAFGGLVIGKGKAFWYRFELENPRSSRVSRLVEPSRSTAWESSDICSLELLAVLCGCMIATADRPVMILCDNASAVDAVNKLAAKSPRLNSLLKALASSWGYSRGLRAYHLSTEDNWLADILSRWSLRDIREHMTRSKVTPHTPKSFCIQLFLIGLPWVNCRIAGESRSEAKDSAVLISYMLTPSWVTSLIQGKNSVYATLRPSPNLTVQARPTGWDLSRCSPSDEPAESSTLLELRDLATHASTSHTRTLAICDQGVNVPAVRAYDEQDTILLLTHSRATSTNASYESVRRGYERFLRNNTGNLASQIEAFPLDIWLLASYVAYLVDVRCERAEKAYKTSTVLQYIRVLLTMSKMHPHARSFTVQENEILRMVRAAVVRVRGKTPTTRACTMTASQLRSISVVTPASGRRRSEVALLVGVAGLLRIREVSELRENDVTFYDGGKAMELRVRWSKTDPGRAGATVTIGCACSPATHRRGFSDVWCPVHRLLGCFDRGTNVAAGGWNRVFAASYEQLSEDIKSLVTLATGLSQGCTTHSMRRTGVVLLHEAGFDDVQIAEYGRWADTRM